MRLQSLLSGAPHAGSEYHVCLLVIISKAFKALQNKVKTLQQLALLQ
jgi:hypothetical protein